MKRNQLHKVLFFLGFILCASSFIPAPAALVGGFLFTLFFGHPFPDLSHKATSLLLKVSVVGLGFGMNATAAFKAGKDGFLLTLASLVLILVLGYLVGRWLKIPTKLSHLVACGTAICGGSAIAAVAPVVNANEKEVSMSLGVVFLLNSIALILFPFMGHFLGLTEYNFGLWSAIAIHDTSSVVGAASAYGEEALMVATTVKLARALWIIPISFLSVFLFKGKGKKTVIPWFILLFVATMLFNSYYPMGINATFFKISKSLLVATLFLIGSSLSITSIKEVGLKPLVLGVILWGIISVLSLVAIVGWVDLH
ncbi:MAG: putative sulfate exporter family transporter [Dysgonamonadaceae bacterium]|nr:putative sulfate exporter family transporter [Dysgonamonadaceae bacterium]